MKFFVQAIQIFIVTLCFSELSLAQVCAPLFSKEQSRIKDIFEINKSLRMLQMISHASIESYRSGDKTLIVVYDKNRASVVVKKERVVEVQNEDGSIVKTYPYTKNQNQALSENLQKLSKYALIASIDPYIYKPEAKETNQYSLHTLARKTLTPREGLRETPPITRQESIRNVDFQLRQSQKLQKIARTIAFAMGTVALYKMPEAQVGLPLLISAYGFAIHSHFSALRYVKKAEHNEQGNLSYELAKKALSESDNVILIAPEFTRKDLSHYLDENFERQN